VVDTGEEPVLLANTLAFGLLVVVVMASDIGAEVHQPAAELLEDHVRGSGNGSLLGELGKLVDKFTNTAGVSLASLWQENHVTLHVASGLVVLAVGDLPGEIRDKQSRVKDPANSVVDCLGRRESLVATLVSEDPDTGAKEALHDGVECPKTSSERCRGDVLGSHVVVEEVESGRQGD